MAKTNFEFQKRQKELEKKRKKEEKKQRKLEKASAPPESDAPAVPDDTTELVRAPESESLEGVTAAPGTQAAS